MEDETLARWKQEAKLLNSDDIQQLKDLVKEAKEAERKRLLEKKKMEREQAAERLREWKKPRDDLACEDHKVNETIYTICAFKPVGYLCRVKAMWAVFSATLFVSIFIWFLD